MRFLIDIENGRKGENEMLRKGENERMRVLPLNGGLTMSLEVGVGAAEMVVAEEAVVGRER